MSKPVELKLTSVRFVHEATIGKSITVTHWNPTKHEKITPHPVPAGMEFHDGTGAIRTVPWANVKDWERMPVAPKTEEPTP